MRCLTYSLSAQEQTGTRRSAPQQPFVTPEHHAVADCALAVGVRESRGGTERQSDAASFDVVRNRVRRDTASEPGCGYQALTATCSDLSGNLDPRLAR